MPGMSTASSPSFLTSNVGPFVAGVALLFGALIPRAIRKDGWIKAPDASSLVLEWITRVALYIGAALYLGMCQLTLTVVSVCLGLHAACIGGTVDQGLSLLTPWPCLLFLCPFDACYFAIASCGHAWLWNHSSFLDQRHQGHHQCNNESSPRIPSSTTTFLPNKQSMATTAGYPSTGNTLKFDTLGSTTALPHLATSPIPSGSPDTTASTAAAPGNEGGEGGGGGGGDGGFPTLLALLYAEFHPVQGPQIVFQSPDHFTTTTTTSAPITIPSALSSSSLSSLQQGAKGLSASSSEWFSSPPIVLPSASTFQFDLISEYIIPKPALCNKLVTIQTEHYQVMGYPVLLKDAKYARNALIFNLCFVFDASTSAPLTSYYQVVRKMARILSCLEEECAFLSSSETKPTLLSIMEQVLEDLNSYHECQIPVNDTNMINLKLYLQLPVPPVIHDYQVPVLMVAIPTSIQHNWDLTCLRILPFINGVHSVKKIADLASAEIHLVKLALRHFAYYGCIKLIDIFQYSNMYAGQPALHLFTTWSKDEIDRCVAFVSKRPLHHATSASNLVVSHVSNPSSSISDASNSFPAPSSARSDNLSDIPGSLPSAFSCVAIFTLLCSFRHGLTVKEWIAENRVNEKVIDVRRLIAYGVLKGLLKRVHKYPVLLGGRTSGKHLPAPIRLLRKLLNGMHHYDELCLNLSCAPSELNDVFALDQNVQFIYR